jgi:hypothetical protein
MVSETSLGELHEILQSAFDWSGEHLHRLDKLSLLGFFLSIFATVSRATLFVTHAPRVVFVYIYSSFLYRIPDHTIGNQPFEPNRSWRYNQPEMGNH